MAQAAAADREVFVHFADTDSRLDRWVDEAAITRSWLEHAEDADVESLLKPALLGVNDRKRKRDSLSVRRFLSLSLCVENLFASADVVRAACARSQSRRRGVAARASDQRRSIRPV